MRDLGSHRLRPLARADVPACAILHRSAFPGFFLSELGLPFLRNFYAAFVDDPDGIAIVAQGANGNICGVVVGTTRPTGFFKRLLLRRWYAFAWSSLGLVVRRPTSLPRLLRAVAYRGGASVDVSGALLSSICVDPAAGRGLGRRLLAAFTHEVTAAGVATCYLTTDAIDNDRVNAFYHNGGWRLEGTYETPEGRHMNCYTWTAGNSENGAASE